MSSMSTMKPRPSIVARVQEYTHDGEAPASFQVEKYAVVLKRWSLRTVCIDALTGDVLVDGRLAVAREENVDLVRCGDGVVQLGPKAQFRPSPDAPLDMGGFTGALVASGWIDVDAEAEVVAPSPSKRVLALQASTPPAHEQQSPFASAPPPWATHAELVAYAKRARRDMDMIVGPLAAQQRLADGGKNSGSPQRELLLHSWRPVLQQWLASGDGRGRGPPVPAPPGALEALSLGFASSLHPQRTLICNAVDRSADAENSLATNEQLEAQRDKGGGAGDGQRVPSAAARKLIVDEVDGVDGGSDDGGEAEAAEAKESALVREAAAAAEAKAAPAAARAQALTPISRRRNEFTELMRGAANAAVENPMRPSSRDASGPMARAPSEAAVGNSGGEEEGAAAGAPPRRSATIERSMERSSASPDGVWSISTSGARTLPPLPPLLRSCWASASRSASPMRAPLVPTMSIDPERETCSCTCCCIGCCADCCAGVESALVGEPNDVGGGVEGARAMTRAPGGGDHAVLPSTLLYQ